jgi:hypothetical protein
MASTGSSTRLLGKGLDRRTLAQDRKHIIGSPKKAPQSKPREEIWQQEPNATKPASKLGARSTVPKTIRVTRTASPSVTGADAVDVQSVPPHDVEGSGNGSKQTATSAEVTFTGKRTLS